MFSGGADFALIPDSHLPRKTGLSELTKLSLTKPGCSERTVKPREGLHVWNGWRGRSKDLADGVATNPGQVLEAFCDLTKG